MDFFNKLGKKASEAYKVTADKTGKLAKEAKLRMKIMDLKSDINKIYDEIGKEVYENYVEKNKKDISKKLNDKCTQIDALSKEIKTILKECLELKDKKLCESCSAEMDKNTKFCPECGKEQKISKVKKEELKETKEVKKLKDNTKKENKTESKTPTKKTTSKTTNKPAAKNTTKKDTKK